ncbi:hypothetical protein CBR_g84859 [Chara braunii]|uniref:Uncharacterized protein n=1 Tax=Chara braunii TaxID=69332 RepID=A0A388KAV7_CHABU|nr:hypothetical protein CBR_g84859 [Chara braunii]|eukprot:GBG67195.1 hypothetical protein CBR_g84859 [Chara braunii]
MGAQWFLDFVVQGDLFGPIVFMRSTCVPDAGGPDNVLPLGTIVSCAKTPGGLLKLHTNGLYDEYRLPLKGVKGVLVTIKSFAVYGLIMTLCSHFKGFYDGGSKRLPSPEQYLDLALMVSKKCPVLPREHVFCLLSPHEGSSGLAQETPGAAVRRGSPIQNAGGRVKGRSVHTHVGPDAPGNTSDLHSQGTGSQRDGTPKLIKVRCGGDTYSLRDETRRESGRSGQDVGGNEAEGMGAVRESSGGEQTPSEKKRERQRMVRAEVAEGSLRMKRMRGKSEAVMGGDGGDVGERASGKKPPKEEGRTASKKARRPGGLTIREGQAVGGGDSIDPGAAAAREPSGKSKRKVAVEEGDGQKKPRRRKTAEAASGGERPVGKECDEAATFWLEYERNDGGEIVERELPVQLLIDPRKPVTRRPEKVDRVHKDVFKQEDKDKYYYNPVNGQHIVATVKELEGQSQREHETKMSKQRSQKAAFLDMREAWEKEGRPMAIQGNPSSKEADKRKFFEFQKLILGKSPNESHWVLAKKDLSLADKEYVAAVGNALRQWMPLVTAGDDVFRKAMEFYTKWAEGKLLGGDGKTPFFLKGMARLSVHHVRTGKWVRNAQKQATVWEGNVLVEECDRLYVIFHGEKLEDNTFAVYPTKASRAHGPSPAKHTVAACSKVLCSSDPSGQAVACFDDEEERFSRSMWEDCGVTSSQGPAYGEMERNPSRLLGLLENFCKAGQTVFFFGKAHASVVWEHLRTGWNIVALEKEAKMIDYLHEFMKTRVADTRNACEFVHTTGEQNWDPKCDMYWKMPRNKRTEVWDFLFQPGQTGPTDLEYSRQGNLVFGVLNGYHDAPRESVSHFLRRLEHVYFTLAEPLTLKNYKSQFDEKDPFDAEDMEELSDSETFDFESMPLPRVVGKVGDEEEGGARRYSTSLAGLKRVFRGEPVDDQSSDDGEEDRDYDHEACDRLPEDHDTWQSDRLYFFGKHHRIFQPAVRNGMWVMAMKEADGKWSGLKRLGAGAFKRTTRTALVEHLSFMNPERNDPDVAAYAEQKLNELYANNMLEFRALFYTLKTAPSCGIDWRMPQPPSGGQHPGGGGGGDEGDGGGGGGDGSQFVGKGTGETSSVEKASGGKGSGEKDSGGKGSGGKGSGGKRRTSGSPEYMETDPHCVGSRDSDMRDEATLTSDQVRVDSHLSARTLFPVAEESPSRRAQQRSPVFNTLLLKEGASSFCLEGEMPALRRSEGATFGSLGSGDRHKLRIHSDLLTSPSAISAPHATVPRGQENVTSFPPHLQLDTGLPYSPLFSCVETRHWRSRDVLEGPAAGVLETGGSEHERHTLGEEERSSGTRAVHREEETQRWQSRKVLETGGSECERHASKGASRDEETRHGPAREDVKWLHARALVIETSEEVLHSRSIVATTREGVVTEGREPVVEGGEVTVDIRTDPQRKDGDCLLTRYGEEQGGRPSALSTTRGMVLHEARELGDDSAATELVSDSNMAEMQNIESSVEGGEVAVNIKMDPLRKDQDSPSTRCGAEQGDRASVLSTGREMVLHEAIDFPSDSAATELVSDTAVAEVQNLESFVDVGAVARQEGEFPQRAPEHGVRLLMSLPMKPLKAVREKRLSGRSLAASRKKSSSVGLFKRLQMPRLSQRAGRALKACGIDKEEGLRKHLAASIESVTALSDGSYDDGKRGVLKDPCPKYIVNDTFNSRGYNFSGKMADSSKPFRPGVYAHSSHLFVGVCAAGATSCIRVPLPTEEFSATDFRMLQIVRGDFSNNHEVVSSVRIGPSSIPLIRKSLQTLI